MRDKHSVKMDDYKFLGPNMKILTYICLWPPSLENRPLLKILYILYCFLMFGTYVTFCVCMTIQIYFVWDDIPQLMNNFRFSLLYIVISAKCSVAFQRKKMRHVIEHTYDFQKKVFNDDSEANKALFLRHASRNAQLNTWFYYMVVVGYICIISPSILCFVQCNDPVYVSGEKAVALPFPSWLPFDTQKYFRPAFFLMTWMAVPGTYYVGTMDTLIFSFIRSAICQARIIQNSFTNLGQSKTKTVYQSAVDGVKLHQSLITYVDDLNDLISTVIFIDFVVYALHMCSIGYTLLVLGSDIEYTEAFSCINYLASALVQLFVFYGLGNQLMLESVAVSDAIWDSDWYTYDAKVKKLLLLVITRSHTPIGVTVGKFYHMNLESLVIILRSFYSFITLLKQMSE